MKTVRKCLCLILGLFIVGLVSCANGSGSDSDSNSPKELLDRDNQPYRDGLYKYVDGTTEMYLYYKYKELIYAGNKEEQYGSSQLNILKQSHTWQNVHQYCSIVSNVSVCKWYYKKTLTEMEFKKGWYEFYNKSSYVGYFESQDSIATYKTYKMDTAYWLDENYRTKTYRTKKLFNNEDKTWKQLCSSCNDVKYYGDDLDYYPEEPSLEDVFKKGWYRFSAKDENGWYYNSEGYFESCNSSMIYTLKRYDEINYCDKKTGRPYRTNQLDRSHNYSSMTLNEVYSYSILTKIIYIGDLDYYPEGPSQSE